MLMKKIMTILLGSVLLAGVWVVPFLRPVKAAEGNSVAPFEYVTLHWDGIANSHFVRPNGAVEFLGTQFIRMKKPERADDRTFFLNVALNTLAKEGYELVSMTADDYVLKKRVR